MARERGTKYIHILYEGPPDDAGNIKAHDLRDGNECWCEPKCARIDDGDTVLVIHDDEDVLLVIEDGGQKALPPGRGE